MGQGSCLNHRYGTGNPYTSSTSTYFWWNRWRLCLLFDRIWANTMLLVLMYFLTKRIRLRLLVVSCFRSRQGLAGKKSLVTKKRIQEMPAISTLLESDDHISSLECYLWGWAFQTFVWRGAEFDCDCSLSNFENALLTLGRMNFKLLKMKIRCWNNLPILQNKYEFSEAVGGTVTKLNSSFMI